MRQPGWYDPKYDDSAWQNAIAYVPPKTPMSADTLGNPWRTGPVKLLRHSFAINKPVTSARLYVTALGAYRFRSTARVSAIRSVSRMGRFPRSGSLPGL